jgi:hypothetical protein
LRLLPLDGYVYGMRATPDKAPPAQNADAIVDDLARSFRATAESIVPWFLSQMPTMYFQDTDRASQMSHLRAIIAAKGKRSSA